MDKVKQTEAPAKFYTIGKGSKPWFAGKNHHEYRHGMSRTKPYNTWCGMINRCYNPKEPCYKRYGGRGITMSADWRNSFEKFWEDMKEGFASNMTIDRIDNDKGYCKENCRWATKEEQAKNKSTVVLYTLNGRSLNASDWDSLLGFKKGTVRARITRYKWPLEKALTIPKTTPKGYHKDQRGFYRVEIKRKGKRYHVGHYKTSEEALEARKSFLGSLLGIKN